ncbi:MAG: hypothetical protein GEU28_14000 [Dehalococcoidia bacterium]|nr:hypothetical protein [Dehalococcoidia bacterium]
MLPVVMAIESVDHAGGDWVRRVSFPQYPGCVAESESMADGINEAYRQLVDRLEPAQAGSGDVTSTTRPLREDLGPVIELYRSLET